MLPEPDRVLGGPGGWSHGLASELQGGPKPKKINELRKVKGLVQVSLGSVVSNQLRFSCAFNLLSRSSLARYNLFVFLHLTPCNHYAND